MCDMIKLKLKPGRDGVRLREAPVDGKPIGQAHTDDVLESLESDEETRRKVGVAGQWLRIRKAEGPPAYIAAWMLDLAEEPVPVDEAGQPAVEVTSVQPDSAATEERSGVQPIRDGVRLREAPVTGTPIGHANRESVLISLESPEETRRKLGTEGEWLQVQTPSGLAGYAAAWFLQAYDGPLPEPPTVPQARNITGVNLDLYHRQGTPDAARLNGLGWVRFGYNVSAAKGSEDINAAYDRYRPHLEKYARAGLKVLLCFTHQTYGEGRNEFWPWPAMTTTKWRLLTGRFTDMVSRIARQYAGQDLVHAYQVWNEQDARLGAEASVPMPPGDYGYLLGETIQAIRAVEPSVPVITGGHTGGPGRGSEYARAAINSLPSGIRPDGVAFHPYGRGPKPGPPYTIWGHIDESMQAYGSVLPGKPVWITEWGVLDREHDNPAAILDYARDVTRHLKVRYPGQVAALIWYAWAMGMHNGYGLVRQDDSPCQPLYDGFCRL
jgi:hypothetical protein